MLPRSGFRYNFTYEYAHFRKFRRLRKKKLTDGHFTGVARGKKKAIF